MTISHYTKRKQGFYTKALRFIDGKKVRFVLGYSVSTNGVRWKDENKRGRSFGLFKTVDSLYTCRALILGKFKLTFMTVN